MNTLLFLERIEKSHPGHSVMVRFTPKGFEGLWRLHRAVMESGSEVRFAEHQMGTLKKAIDLRAFTDKDVQSRTYNVFGITKLSNGELERVAEYVEDISVPGNFEVGPIASAHKVAQFGLAERTVTDILTEGFLKEIQGWGLSVVAPLLDNDGLPVLVFAVRSQSRVVMAASINTWSGCVYIEKTLQPDLFSCGSFRRAILERLPKALEKLTSAPAT